MDSYKYIESIYKKIRDTKKKHGTYHKTLLHLHTPASYDYKLLSDWEENFYRKVPEDKLLEICIKQNVVPSAKTIEGVQLDGKRNVYSSKSEFIYYLLIANEIIKNKYEIVVVTDHNCIDGVKKLENAVCELMEFRKVAIYPEIIHGIEISCADKLHVVGVFAEEKKEKVQQWLNENLVSTVDGTFQTSFLVMKFFKEVGGIAYIAHINSSLLFDKEKYLSGGYKKKLKEADCFEYVGVHEKKQVDKVSEVLRRNGINTNGFVIDNDAHDIESIGKNYFWIKSGKRSFKTLKEAFDDFEISVAHSIRAGQNKYIKGILIEKGGFLKGNRDEDFVLTLSDSLNCFIGGRGTGKSTVLQIIDYALGLRVSNEANLDFICKHGNIWILFEDCGNEYMICMCTPEKSSEDERILNYFGQNEANLYGYQYIFSKESIREYARKKYIKVYKISTVDGKIDIKHAEKMDILTKIYDMKYSVNDLVQVAGDDQIDEFIRHLLLQNIELFPSKKSIRCRSKKMLSKAINEIPQIIDKRKTDVEKVIIPFNDSMKKTLRIVYRQDGQIKEPDFEEWLFNGFYDSRTEMFDGCAITKENAIEFLFYVWRKVGIVTLLKMALGEDRYRYDVSDFVNNVQGDKENQKIIDAIFDKLITDENYKLIIDYLNEMIRDSEKLSLEFNIKNCTTSEGEKYVDVRCLSLGLKVVAMLDLIFGYGEFINERRPIIIDQPEDNLDSQYIYDNLVKQLRRIKDKRQIIIATHSSTIVTNAMADQVCVMDSDGDNGWIKKMGYPSENDIKKEIVNYLEGGKKSFKHKMKVYEPVINV